MPPHPSPLRPSPRLSPHPSPRPPRAGYTLLTRAGFTVDRKGTACVHVVGGAIVGLVTGTTGQRFKSLEADLRACTESFRAYAVKKPDFAFLNGAA